MCDAQILQDKFIDKIIVLDNNSSL